MMLHRGKTTIHNTLSLKPRTCSPSLLQHLPQGYRPGNMTLKSNESKEYRKRIPIAASNLGTWSRPETWNDADVCH